MTSPKATARGLWLLSYTFRHLSGVRRCNMLDARVSRIGRFRHGSVAESNDETQVLQSAIELFQIEWLAEIAIAAVFQRGLFHAVNVVGRDGNDGDVLSTSLELAKALDCLQSIKNRHIQVNNHQARSISLGHVESLLPVFSFENVVSLQFKRV